MYFESEIGLCNAFQWLAEVILSHRLARPATEFLQGKLNFLEAHRRTRIHINCKRLGRAFILRELR